MSMNWNRILSCVVATVCVLGGFRAGGAKGGLIAALFVILPLAYIWFSDAISRVGLPGRRHWIIAASPSLFIRILGWITLILVFLFILS